MDHSSKNVTSDKIKEKKGADQPVHMCNLIGISRFQSDCANVQNDLLCLLRTLYDYEFMFYVPFNIILGIMRPWKGDYERLCASSVHSSVTS